jgi:hypothetical protein
VPLNGTIKPDKLPGFAVSHNERTIVKKVTLSVTAFVAGALAFNEANAQTLGGVHGVAVNPGGNTGGNGGPGPINGVVLNPGGNTGWNWGGNPGGGWNGNPGGNKVCIRAPCP